MAANRPLTVLCVATYEKGQEFLREARRAGCRVLLLTLDSLRHADWPHESIDETFYIPKNIPREALLKGVSGVAERETIDRIVALDDFDVETAALLREHLRVAGMGETTARYFRDKLAMRMRARYAGIAVPDFVHVLNRDAIAEYASRVPPPWLLKPRSQAAAIGIQRVSDQAALWQAIGVLGDERSFYLLERFVPGDVYHVDSVIWDGRVVFAAAHRYGRPPWEVAHQGGVFTTRTLPRDGAEAEAVVSLNARVIEALGLRRGVSHTEFIRAHEDGRFYFLETSARVGGAHIVDVVEAASGINLWREWARLEVAGEDGQYQVPEPRLGYAGLALSLARQAEPDTSAYADPEIVMRVRKNHHAGLIVASPDPARVEALLDDYARRFAADFLAALPAPDRPSS